MKPRSTRSIRCRLTPARSTCAPIIRMRAAPLRWAATRRAANSAKSGCEKEGGGSSRRNQWPWWRSCSRSESRNSLRRERSNSRYFDAIRKPARWRSLRMFGRFSQSGPSSILQGHWRRDKHCREDLLEIFEVRNDEIRADLNQALALPLVNLAAIGLGAGHADCCAAHFLYFL